MNGLRLRKPRYCQNVVHVQITILREWAAHAIAFVSQIYMQGLAISLRKDGYRLDAHFSARSNDSHGDLASVGNQYFREHVIPL
jgi:hypothetical protein